MLCTQNIHDNQTMKIFPKDAVRQSLFIFLLGAAVGLLVNFFHPHGVKIALNKPSPSYAADAALAPELPPVHVQGPKEETADEPEVTEGPVVISKQQVKSLLSQGHAIAVDARLPDDYAAGHIPGAINIPYDDLYQYGERVGTLPKDKWIISYCDGPPCDLGDMLAYELVNRGLQKVAIYEQGFDEWKSTEPVEKGGE
jgi:rhodanese-related sulfurtransferase